MERKVERFDIEYRSIKIFQLVLSWSIPLIGMDSIPIMASLPRMVIRAFFRSFPYY